MAEDLKKMYRTVMDDHFPPEMEISFIDQDKRQTLFYKKVVWVVDEVQKGLRYGENPGQEAALYKLVNGNLVLRLIFNGLKTQFMGHMEGLGEQIELNEVERSRILKKLDAAIAARDSEGAGKAARENFNLIREKIFELLVAMSADNASVGS